LEMRDETTPNEEKATAQMGIISSHIVPTCPPRPTTLSTERLFQEIANQDHGLTPSVRGRVHIVDPAAEVLLHMYDDRGMDAIATSVAPLGALKSSCESVILNPTPASMGATQ
jgi:hypothetical protein